MGIARASKPHNSPGLRKVMYDVVSFGDFSCKAGQENASEGKYSQIVGFHFYFV